jgi:endoribonuclease Dicer
MGWGNADEVQEDSDVDEYMPDYETTNGDDKQTKNDVQNEMNGDDSDDDEPEAEEAHPARTVSEKRRAENDIFRMYATLKTARITEKEVKEVTKNLTDDKLSIRDILAKEENSRKIVNPRDYQTELFQRAKDENIIAVLDTGTGKTHIATLLLRHILDSELESRAKGLPPKVAFFLVSYAIAGGKIFLTGLGGLRQSCLSTGQCPEVWP